MNDERMKIKDWLNLFYTKIENKSIVFIIKCIFATAVQCIPSTREGKEEESLGIIKPS